MSAFIVHKRHIDALVQAVHDCKMPWSDTPAANDNALGRILWAENHKSVNYRYRNHQPETPPDYVFQPISVSPLQILKAISCYEYQTCEHPGWRKNNKVREFADQLRHYTIHKLPGYEEAEWEITDAYSKLLQHCS